MKRRTVKILAAITCVLVSGFVYVLNQAIDQFNHGEWVTLPTETTETLLRNGAKLISESTRTEYIGFKGDRWNTMELYYQSEGAEHREYLGKMQGWPNFRDYSNSSEVAFTLGDTLFMLSKQDEWKKWIWREDSFPGDNNPETSIIFERNPNNGGLFYILDLSFDESELKVRSSRPYETHDLRYTINTERNEIEFQSVRFIDELDRLKELLDLGKFSFSDYERAVEKELERRSNKAVDTTATSRRVSP